VAGRSKQTAIKKWRSALAAWVRGTCKFLGGTGASLTATAGRRYFFFVARRHFILVYNRL
jgi:hypothetical protein